MHSNEYYNRNHYVQKKDFAMQFEMEEILNKKLRDTLSNNQSIGIMWKKK